MYRLYLSAKSLNNKDGKEIHIVKGKTETGRPGAVEVDAATAVAVAIAVGVDKESTALDQGSDLDVDSLLGGQWQGCTRGEQLEEDGHCHRGWYHYYP